VADEDFVITGLDVEAEFAVWCVAKIFDAVDFGVGAEHGVRRAVLAVEADFAGDGIAVSVGDVSGDGTRGGEFDSLACLNNRR